QAAGAYWDLGMNGEGGGAADRFDLNRSAVNFVTVLNNGNMGIGNAGPASKLHVMGKLNLHQSGGGGGENRFEGLEGATTANGRAQFVMSSAYSDLVIASSQVNDNHGSTLSFVTYNPSNSGDYRKFVINQGNWGNRRYFLDFGYADAGGRTNPHANINGTDQVMTLDGINKRVGIGGVMSPSFTLDVNGKMRARRGGYTMGNANEGQIEIGNAGSGDCFISFHREGAYGAQFGLASDNWFSTYGWSAGGGYTPIRMGSAQVNGDLTVTGTINGYIPNNGSGDWQIASNSGSTSYSTASLELRETNFGGGGQTPPHLGFHWGGVVASNIAIEADGTIAIRDNPGTGYEKFKCATIRTSGITETSDARLKKEVQPIANALATVLRLRGVNYKWKTNEELKSEKISYQTNDDVNPKGEMGFIAQEVEEILPELVNTDKEGFKSMEYSKMVALLVEAYKDLHKEHEQLQGQYGKQQQQIDVLFGQVQMLMQQTPVNGAASIHSTITK
ncbi:MAG TPA: tail fiber domain-containing protein, partial [Chitinophagales bacterium]|nr:tail fiber domain-containing protein [Chitinophagales bacterium]